MTSALQQLHNIIATVDVLHSEQDEQRYKDGDYSKLQHDGAESNMYVSVAVSHNTTLQLTLTDIHHTWQLQWSDSDLKDHCQRNGLRLKSMEDMVKIFKTAFLLPHHLYVLQPASANGTISKRVKHSQSDDGKHDSNHITLHTIYKISDMELTSSVELPLLDDSSSDAALSTMVKSLVNQAVQQQNQHAAAVAKADQDVANELSRLQALVNTRE